jgi:hypothetical protein
MDAGVVSARVAMRHKLLVGVSPQIHVLGRLSVPVFPKNPRMVSPLNRWPCSGDRWIPLTLDSARVSCLCVLLKVPMPKTLANQLRQAIEAASICEDVWSRS